MGDIAEIFSSRATADDLTVCLPAGYSDENAKKILEKILSQTGMQPYRRLYK